MNQHTSLSLDPYGGTAADSYDRHHRSGLRTKLTTWRERAVLSKALRVAGSGLTALDLPCGAGRFWPVFEQAGVTRLIAGDISEGMLRVADGNRLSDEFPARLEPMSAFDIDLPDNAVDVIACMRFLHHLALPQDRQQVLRELHRVARQYVAVSLWVDGNLGAWRRRRKTPPEVQSGFGRRRCRSRREVEDELRCADFEIVDHFDVWPTLSMWRLYLLRCE